jgi:hypothetical protein
VNGPALASILCLVPGALAQELAWRLPPRGFVEWQRKETLSTQVVETRESPAPAADCDLWIFPGPRFAPLLFHGELDARGHALATPPRLLRDLPQWLACDLSPAMLKAGKRRFVVPRILPFGDLHLAVQVEKPDSGDGQRITATVQQAPVDPAGESKSLIEQWFAHETRHTLAAEIEIDRELDRAQGIVAGFRVRFRGEVGYPPEHPRRRATFKIAEEWRDARVHENRADDFDGRVAAGIRSAAGWLGGKLVDLQAGDLDPAIQSDGTTFGSGRLALVTLALLKAGEDPREPPLRTALDELRRRDLRDTYSLANAILAFEALYAPAGERELLLSGRIGAPLPRVPSDGDRALLQEWTRRLLANVDTRVDAAYRRRWNYVRADDYDNSNTQYALLGLHAALLCGIEVPAAVWRSAAEHWLAEQQLDKARNVRLRLVTQTDHDKLLRGEPLGTSAAMLVVPGGFTYGEDGKPPTGSMTAGGVAGLVLCEAALKRLDRLDAALRERIRRAVRSGFAWLGEEFTVRANPGFAPVWPHWRCYWLYGVERACELAGVGLLQDRDWYFEGSTLLLAWQQGSGEVHPGGLDNTCFAILFWKKAALPVWTGR